MGFKEPTLFVTDIDNTLFDWVSYYTEAIEALFAEVTRVTGVGFSTLAGEAREVFARHGSIEYPFLVQELPSVAAYYGHDVDRLLHEAVEPARKRFLEVAGARMNPFSGVTDTLTELRQGFGGRVPLIALTDAPRYVAMWKMNKLGLLHLFDAVYGLPDPRVPIDTVARRAKVDSEILLKHLDRWSFGFTGKIRILPEEYEKPGIKGLKTVLLDYELDEDPARRREVLWIGDNLRKDVGLGSRLGVHTAWASYGARIAEDRLAVLRQISPPRNLEKNANLHPGDEDTPKPTMVLERFSDLLDHLRV